MPTCLINWPEREGKRQQSESACVYACVQNEFFAVAPSSVAVVTSVVVVSVRPEEPATAAQEEAQNLEELPQEPAAPSSGDS